MKTPLKVPKVMPEAYEYETNPASFSRGMLVPLIGNDIVFVSGTASIGLDGKTKHKGNFVSQANLMFDNVTAVLEKANVNWKNVVKVTIYLKNIASDYETFNKVRKDFFDSVGIYPYPASTCVGAELCRSDLLCEMEVIAIR
jgi:enamine deaminase RidA (YjgF/YER057c/UK114 family)